MKMKIKMLNLKVLNSTRVLNSHNLPHKIGLKEDNPDHRIRYKEIKNKIIQPKTITETKNTYFQKLIINNKFLTKMQIL